MSIYEQLKKSAYKNKYQIAFCGQFNRVRYDEMLRGVDSAYNILHNMGANGRNFLILLKNSPQLVYLFYGAMRLGSQCIFAHPYTSSYQFEKLVRELNPVAVFIEADEFERYSLILKRIKIPNTIVNANRRQASSFTSKSVFVLSKLLKENDFKTADKLITNLDLKIGFWGGCGAEHQLNFMPVLDFLELASQKKAQLKENKKLLFKLMLCCEDGLAIAHAALTAGYELDLKPFDNSLGFIIDNNFLRPQYQTHYKNGSFVYPKDIESYIEKLEGVNACRCEILSDKVRITVYHSLNEIEAAKLISSKLARNISLLNQDELKEYNVPFTVLFINAEKKDLTI